MKKFYNLMLITLLTVVSVNAQIFIWEDFNDGSMPSGWTPPSTPVDNNTGSCGTPGIKLQTGLSFFNNTRTFTTDATSAGTSDGTDLTVSFDYNLFDQGATVSDIGNVKLEYSVNGAAFVELLGTSDFISTVPCVNITATIPAADVPSGETIAFKFTSQSISALKTMYIDNFRAYQSLSCLPLSAVTIDGVSTDSVDFSWTAGDDMEGIWEYVVQTAGTGTPSAAGTEVSMPMVTGADDGSGALLPATQYEIWVRGNCGDATTPDYSPWVGPLLFYTNCVPFTATYEQNFDSTTAPDLDVCWTTMIDGSTASGSVINTYTTVSASLQSRIHSLPNAVNINNTNDTSGSYYLISPEFSDDLTMNRVRFWVNATSTAADSGDELELGVMSDPSDVTTFESLETYTSADLANGGEYVEFIRSLDDYTGTGTYIALKYNPGVNYHPLYVDDFTYEPIPSCLEPLDITITDVTDVTATASWTDPNATAASTYDYIVQPATDPEPDATSNWTNTADNPLSLMGLDPNTDYVFYVRAVCSATDTSEWISPATFRTNCSTFMATHYDDFNALASNTIDPCWTALIAETTSTSGSIAANTSQNYPSTPGASMRLYNGSDTDGDYYLITPEYSDLAGTSDKRVRFRLQHQGDTELLDTYEVGMMTDPADATTFTSIATINSADYQTNEWSTFVITDLGTAAADQKYVAIKYKPSGTFNSFYIDEYYYETIPSCLEPTDIEVSEVSNNSATISWTAPTGTDTWEYVFLPAGDPDPTDTTTGTETTDNPVTDMTLMESTDYDVWVRTVCTDGSSYWTGPIPVSTKCAPEMVTYTETFDSYTYSAPPSCWTEAKGGDPMNGFVTSGPTASTWGPDGFNNAGTTGAAKLAYNNNVLAEWLISPLIDLTDDLEYELTFDLGVVNGGYNGTTPANFEGDDYMDVLISTDYGTTWTVLETFDSSTTIDGEYNAAIDLTDYATNIIQLAFFGSAGTDGATTSYDSFIDNFEVRQVKEMDWVNVQYISSNPAESCQVLDIYTQGYEPGITDTTPGVEDPTLSVWVAVSMEDTDPSTWDDALWQVAAYNASSPDDANNDEYSVQVGPLAAGTYYVASRWQIDMDNYVYGGDGGIYDGTTYTNMELVVEEVTPISAMADMETICEGEEVTLTASSDDTTFTYVWDNDGGEGESVMVSPSETTTYTVTGTNENGCISTAEITVTVNAAPDAPMATVLQEFCPTDNPTTADLVATPNTDGNTIVWYDAATEGNELMDAALEDGSSYYAAEVSAEGCESLTRTLVIANFDNALCAPEAPENDDCGNADMLAIDEPGVPGTTIGSTVDPTNTCDPTLTGSWYTVVGDGSDVTVTVTPSNTWDPSLTVLEGTCDGGFACTDNGVVNNAGAGEAEALTFPSEEGVTYYIMTGYAAGETGGTFAIQVTSNLGIEDIQEFDNAITLYPNPVVDVLHMNVDQPIRVAQVFSLDGRLVKEDTNLTENTINVHNLQTGTYLIRVILDDQTVFTEQFIKK